ncbi:G2/M phase-specific E3 ubiquitin-protein ligase [Merluccius polli]|uniref:G2/M phase-specific E3 ubiquitin-protein ligase n=1 Tax=Merluccius polli TaxID=89951 RepID=A0AA47M3W3_MERPO|nr:G2/M phase-specific E3 ubiquitin-protein ligase [Merluccius polli]
MLYIVPLQEEFDLAPLSCDAQEFSLMPVLGNSEDILNWISNQVDEGSTFSICVSRSDLFNRGIQQWQRQKRSSPKCRLKVTFMGEAGIDTGALSKEFLTEMIAGIESKLFIGSDVGKGKNPLYCLNSLDKNYFRTAGEVMAASMAQGGPPPNFMREWCYRYLCSGDLDSVQGATSDVTDLELSQLIMEINSATEENIHELVDGIVSCGYTGKVSVDKKELMISVRVIPMLEQLRKGLQLYGLLGVLAAEPDLCLPLSVDAAFMLEKFLPSLSEKGSLKHDKEMNIMNFLQDYLQQNKMDIMMDRQLEECYNGLRGNPTNQSFQVKRRILSSTSISIMTDGNHTICFPTVSACSRTITFPVAHSKTFDEFANLMNLALAHGQSFYNV